MIEGAIAVSNDQWVEWWIPVSLFADWGKVESIKQLIAEILNNPKVLDFKQLPPDEYGRNIKYALLVNNAAEVKLLLPDFKNT